MSFYNHITTVEIAERGALSAMPIGTAVRGRRLTDRLAALSLFQFHLNNQPTKPYFPEEFDSIPFDDYLIQEVIHPFAFRRRPKSH